jgi:Putative rRNA methylase
MRATELAHLILQRAVKPGAWAVDATVGNGYDTLFLAHCVGPTGRVFGFDVQETALAAAAQRVHGLPQVTLYHSGHERLVEHLPADAKSRLAAVMFNLGYLPGGDHSIVTRAETTLTGLGHALGYLAAGGLMTLVLYPGHPGGADEAAAVRDFAQHLPADYAVTQHTRINALHQAPELLVIERTA